MTSDEFRQIALGFLETEESSHMDHPDFRVGGKIFATLGPDETWGMAKLTPTQQQIIVVCVEDYVYLVPFVESDDEIFLKTIIPSSKAPKKYLGNENE